MAYEVARVHGLIMSNIQDGEKDSSETWPLSKGIYQTPPRLSPDTPFLYDFPAEFNQWSESSHCSSLESSTETETESDDEDDFIAGLAEQIAHSMLEDDEPSSVSGRVDNSSTSDSSIDVSLLPGRVNAAPQKQVAVPSQSSWSPNSLSASWSDSVSSSKQSSEVSSPPSTPSTSEGDAWDLLNAAAGEVVRLKMNEDRRPPLSGSRQAKVTAGVAPNAVMQCNRVPPQPTAWRTLPHLFQLSTPSSCNAGARSSAAVQASKDRLPASGGPSSLQKSWTRPRDEERKVCNGGPAQYRVPRNGAEGWNQRQNKPGNSHKGGFNQKAGRQNYNYGGHPRLSAKSVDCNGGLQRSGGQGVNGGSGMRAVFLGSGGSGRESGGTGVFLPRCVGSGSEHRRKPACSTVLLPSRIVQVLNLNVEDMRSHPAPLPVVAAHSRNEYAGAVRTPSTHMYMMELSAGAMNFEAADGLSTFPRKVQSPHIRQSEPIEFRLPTEWTY